MKLKTAFPPTACPAIGLADKKRQMNPNP